jgi:predicted metalloprotease
MMKAITLTILMILGATAHAKPSVDMDDISCIEAATGGPRGEYTGRQIHMILLSIENWWRGEFARRGLPFQDVGYKVFSGYVQTGCGPAQSEMGPFYCMADGFIYVDPSFFYTPESLKTLGEPTKALLTFVLAHEFGHHIQNLLDVMPRVNNYARMKYGGGWFMPNIDFGPPMEYQADCLGGVYLNQLYSRDLLTLDEVKENVRRMARMGDDFVLAQGERERRIYIPWFLASGGYSHGTSEKRQQWMVRGAQSGEMHECESFEIKTLN